MIAPERERWIRRGEQGVFVFTLLAIFFIPISESAKNIAVVGALTLWAMTMLWRRRLDVRVPVIGWFLLGLLGAVTLSALRWDVITFCRPLTVARGVADVFIYTSFFLLIVNTLRGESHIWLVLWVMIIATGLGDLAGAYTYFFSNTGAARLSVPGLSFTAAYLAMALTMMAALLLHVRFDAGRRWLIGGIMALTVIALVFTHTRSMWLITLLNLGIFSAANRVWKWPVGLLAFFVVVAFVAMASDNLIRQRVISMGLPLRDESLLGRVPIWQSAMRMARDHPVLGVGPKCFRASREKYHVPEDFGQAHNQWFHVAAELGGLGVLALTMFLAAYISWLIRIRRNVTGDLEKALWMTCLGSFLVILIGGIIDPVFRQQVALFFTTLTGLAIVSTGLVGRSGPSALPDPCEVSGGSSRGTAAWCVRTGGVHCLPAQRRPTG